ncbi:MAG: pilus assembly protein TadG-related protein [Acidimicrobiales bacterium]
MSVSDSTPSTRFRGDAGQLVPLMVLVVLLVVVIGVVVVRLGLQIDRRARAQTTADAAALAGAAEGEDIAGSVTEANGAVLESFEVRGPEVEVVVRLGDQRATARARREW